MSDRREGRKPGREPSSGDIATIATFLAWQHPNVMSGGVTADDAVRALARIAGMDAQELRRIGRIGE